MLPYSLKPIPTQRDPHLSKRSRKIRTESIAEQPITRMIRKKADGGVCL